MIDLSFLTEEEAEAIMKVLQRDAVLKKSEEERVRHLPEKVKDDVQLKNMSGQWFYEAKSKRHRDKIHGADIIRASMRWKPAKLAEINCSPNTWVSNFNKEVFVPPELHVIGECQEQQQMKSISSSKTTSSLPDKPEKIHMKASIPSVKQRRNPFNSTSPGDNLNSGESENRPANVPQLPNKEILSLSQEGHPKPNLQNDETEKCKKPSVETTDESQKGLVKCPVPKPRKLVLKATNPVSQREDLVPKPDKWTERISVIATRPGGILKHSSSSTDSDACVSQMLDVQKKNGLPTATVFEGEDEKSSRAEVAEDARQLSREKLKQVRFSSSPGEPLQSPQIHHSRETDEFDLLESNEIKSSRSDAIRSESFGNKQISAVKPLGTYSSALRVKTINGLQENKSASSHCNTNKSVFLVNEALQTKAVAPKKLETLQKTSNNTLPNTNNELCVDEICGNKSNQILSHESNSHQNLTDEHQLSSKTDAHEVSNTKSATLQQGKPDLVEKQDSITTFKPDKHADELMEAADEAVSKDLLCFKRSSGSEDRKRVSVRPLGRQPTEKVDLSSRIAVLPTEHSGPHIDGKTIVAKELPFGKMKKQTSNPPASFISEDTQIKERMKPKKGEENEEQNDKSLIEYDCIRAKEKECGQEIKQQIQTPNFLEHQEQKLSAQKYESEKAIKEKRRIKEIRAFWERNKTIPSHGEKEASPNTNVSGGGVLKGLRECDRIKPTTVYRPHELDDQRKNMLRSDDLNYASQVSGNEHQNSFEFGPGHAVQKIERTVPSGGEFHEYTELAKPSNLQPRDAATLAFPETKDKDEKETFKGKVAAGSQQKPKFQVLSLKEKMNEKSGNQISDPSHFQSLRNFWDNGVKSQNSVDRGDFSLSNNTSLINYERKAKEDKKGRDNMTKQQLIQQQMQTSEREKTQKLYSVVCELPLGSPTLKGLNVTHTKNTDPVQLDKRKVISKPQEKMSLPEQAVKECLKKSIVSSKELPSPGDKEALKDIALDDLLCFPVEKVENKTTFLDDSLPQEKVAETVDKVVLPKAEVDVFRLSLDKLEKEASETSSSLNLKENILKDRTFHSYQCRVFGRIVEQSPDISSAYQKEEISKNTGKMNTLSSDEHENKKSLRKLFREFEPFCLQHQAANKVVSWGSQEPQADLQNLLRETFASQPSEYKSVVMKKSNDMKSISKTNCSIESTGQDDTDQPEEVSEIIEKSVAPSKVRSLSSALKKLLEEASETPPPKPRCAESTVQRIAEMEVKNRTYEHDGDLLQEIRETIEKSVAPSKVSGLGSALKKLLEEATETPPPKPRCAESTIWRTAENEVKSRTYEHDGDLLQEVSETIEKSVAPSKVSGLSSALKKLLEEASETPPPKPRCAESTIQRTAESEVKSRTYEHDGDLLQEISETIRKSSVLPKAEYEVFDVNLQKLLKEVSETPASVLENLGSEEELNPVLMVLKRSADRKMPSKSLEDIPSAISNKGKNNNPKEELALSAEDGPRHDQHQERNENASGISTVPSQPDKLFSNPEKLRLCQSVPSFLQEESNVREADTASESSYSFGRSKKSPSSLINLSSSSGKASLSPVSRNLMSICSADFDNVEVKGNIQFAIDYVEQLNELYIFIHQCKDLAVADVKRQRSDPYVKTYLHPEKYKLGKRKTSVKKNTLNPVYNETLRYKIEKDLLKNQSLNISVWHNDTFGRNSFLGQVELDLQTWDWNDISRNQHNWFPLKPRTLTVAFTPENRGEIKLALKYVPHHAEGKKTPSTGEVHIWVKKYCDPLLRGNRLNSFIHCTILPDNISGQKTRTMSKTTNPVFNCIMIYKGFKPEDLKEICIQLTIWDHNKFSIHFLGGLRIGLGTGESYGITVDWMDSTSDESTLWKKIMNSPNTWIEDTLPLRMLKVEKLTK